MGRGKEKPKQAKDEEAVKTTKICTIVMCFAGYLSISISMLLIYLFSYCHM